VVGLSRILIFAETVTLAHIARPIALSRLLRQLGHDVGIAASSAAERWLAAEGVVRHQIDSIDSSAFLIALARGMPPYDLATLKRYVEDDLRAIAAWAPDIVIGDFRLSLYISARLARKPYGAIANAYWSRRYWSGSAAPAVPPLRWLPQPIADRVFTAVYPAAFAIHALPFHRACRFFDVKPPGLDIRDVYTASDATAFADVEGFYAPSPTTKDTPLFLGPLAWEPPGTQPLPSFPDGLPIVFVALGSSGEPRVLSRVLDGIGRLPVRCIVATGASAGSAALPANCIHSAQFIPYAPGCSAATLLVCNGGAPAVYAGLGQGRPVLAIPSNLDQHLNCRALRRTGAVFTASDKGKIESTAQLVARTLATPSWKLNALAGARAVKNAAGNAARASEQWVKRLGNLGSHAVE
jgi:UDP:flavonoid glycosyltransferase YjiC (YdhE family)